MKKKLDPKAELCVEFAIAVMAAVDVVKDERHKKGKPVELEPLVTALVSVLAHQVAGIPDQDDRMMFFAKIGSTLFEAIQCDVALGSHAVLYDSKELH